MSYYRDEWEGGLNEEWAYIHEGPVMHCDKCGDFCMSYEELDKSGPVCETCGGVLKRVYDQAVYVEVPVAT